jgi:hypothetical protein
MNTDLIDASVHIPVVTIDAPSHEEIAERAYQLYEQRGAENGHDVEDWLQSQRQLILERVLAARRAVAA